MSMPENNSLANKRIAKNTVLLYMRMLLLLAISLYTSRIVLNTLGVTDYGIYNVVGGVITILGFVTGSLGGATSRYITTALGKGDKHALLKLFSSILFIHYFAGAIIFCAERNRRVVVCSHAIEYSQWQDAGCNVGLPALDTGCHCQHDKHSIQCCDHSA